MRNERMMQQPKFSPEQIAHAIRKPRVGFRLGMSVGSSGLPNKPSTPGKEVRATGREQTPPAAAGRRGEQLIETTSGRSLA